MQSTKDSQEHILVSLAARDMREKYPWEGIVHAFEKLTTDNIRLNNEVRSLQRISCKDYIEEKDRIIRHLDKIIRERDDEIAILQMELSLAATTSIDETIQ